MRTSAAIAAVGFFALLLLFSSAAKPVHAARAADRCAFTASDVKTIQDPQANPASNPSEKFSQELTARKTLLVRIADCAKADAQSLRGQLDAVSVEDSLKPARQRLEDSLGDAMNYYDTERSKIDGAGVAGTRAIAGEMLAWRREQYNVLEGQAGDFLLWSDNQNLFSAARTRLDQLERAVRFVEQAAPNDDLRGALDAARAAFRGADDENGAARSAIAQFLPPDQSLALIQQSLQSLSDAYQNFLTVGGGIQKLILISK